MQYKSFVVEEYIPKVAYYTEKWFVQNIWLIFYYIFITKKIICKKLTANIGFCWIPSDIVYWIL